MSNNDATQRQRKVSPATYIVIGGTALLIVMIAIALLGTTVAGLDFTSASSSAGGVEVEETKKPTPTPEPTPTPSAKECPPEFVVTVQFRKDSAKLINAEFDKEVLAASEKEGDAGVKRVYLKYSASDPTTLAAYAHARQLTPTLVDPSTLVENGCLSEKGQELYHDLEVITNWEKTKFDIGTVDDPNAYNSGLDENGNYGVDQNPGVHGDLRAIVITEEDGTVTYVLLRCGNPVYPGKPNLPTVRTDNPEPERPTGTGGDCVDCATDDSKSAANDPIYPGGGQVQLGPSFGEPATETWSPAPAAPVTAEVTPHVDTGAGTPVTGAGQLPAGDTTVEDAEQDPTDVPATDAPGTESGDPG